MVSATTRSHRCFPPLLFLALPTLDPRMRLMDLSAKQTCPPSAPASIAPSSALSMTPSGVVQLKSATEARRSAFCRLRVSDRLPFSFAKKQAQML